MAWLRAILTLFLVLPMLRDTLIAMEMLTLAILENWLSTQLSQAMVQQ